VASGKPFAAQSPRDAAKLPGNRNVKRSGKSIAAPALPVLT